ncbi:MAG: menaquinone biosynthesis protein [Bacteroidota bacterium]|nr:menaquinone biosynthesis protein [Bacteroidota bacterium]
MQKINVSVVSYSNSIPFVYGLLNSEVINDINLSLDIPAVCADKVLSGTADVGLMPIVETLRLPEFNIASDLCIGAVDKVRTVILASDVPVEDLSEIYLDYQSRTSVVLVRVLAKFFWKITPQWIPAGQGFETQAISGNSGAVIIGDRAFEAKSKYCYDLAQEWIKFTGLPFVFAAWIANKELGEEFKVRFNEALGFGIQNLEASAKLFYETHQTEADILDYLKHNISYPLDEPKRQAMELFLKYAREIIG